ncbi:hypothetical protein QBC36DRAFT_332575 [Triangularia setosa]|uniref:Uncharacterized protein n=1 Tax=Triangularia setosa TaxID=2587417 RepID=A0AAN7A6B5_9PEZI|nr:hypothetical protein QBC36DRAFT_332575 [Podospora setosa]
MRTSGTLLLSLGGLVSTTTALAAPDFLWGIIDKIDRRWQYDCECVEHDLYTQCCASVEVCTSLRFLFPYRVLIILPLYSCSPLKCIPYCHRGSPASK